MALIEQKTQKYTLYFLSCTVIFAASITLILSLYRLQRDTSLLDRERKRDYVTNKINKSFPTIAIIISIIICLSSLLSFIAIIINGRTEMLIISIVSNIILGIGSIILSIIKLGFVQNIVENFPVDIERLLADFIIYNKTNARDELIQIENSNDCCTTQHSMWVKEYSQAAECNRDEKYRMLYADQDEQRGCVKVITRTALSFMPVIIAELICGCLCLLLGLWSIYFIYHINKRYKSLKTNKNIGREIPTTEPVAIYPNYQPNNTVQNVIPNMKNKDNQVTKIIDTQNTPQYSYPLTPQNKIDRTLYINPVPS